MKKPFKKLFAVLQEKHVHPLKAKSVDVATGLLIFYSAQKYGTFWDPRPILKKLHTDRPWGSFSVSELRSRLILLFCLLALHRGIDLARTQRTISVVGDKHFILVQRKGWKTPRWEQVAKVDDDQSLSPFHVMAAYVKKTAPFVP